ncbi:DNA-binding centromere protein B (CENP-B) [Plasmopara halstedii]|uniref:DNA-binding centromere protein B (CENP-B) n=1 Tax=Plasmopara halstedii TaxID=4781 RepID=A0A0P1B4M2_PLAHL|nr:DNA-binding centromere protein B (CENP-B) [Plasmopara halstedii]CEG48978.1 DNA-binding centromere protein B (CENP-B) [Plasmopara halstedii]|eukprot:XP_024585347.1 DNA-binding centromere protein B (CENP-B) [Plasmopara halstedii]
MGPRGAKHTTMSDKIRIALCQHKEKNPKLTHEELIKWIEENHQITVSGSTITNTLKRSVELLDNFEDANLDTKRQRTVRYPNMESALFEWLTTYQDQVNMSGDLLKKTVAHFLDRTPWNSLFPSLWGEWLR